MVSGLAPDWLVNVVIIVATEFLLDTRTGSCKIKISFSSLCLVTNMQFLVMFMVICLLEGSTQYHTEGNYRQRGLTHTHTQIETFLFLTKLSFPQSFFPFLTVHVIP